MLFGDEHVRRYRETGGEAGYLWNDVTTLIPETTGRHTGKPRAKALIFGQDGDRMAQIWPAYNDCQRKTDRQIPVVVLEREEP